MDKEDRRLLGLAIFLAGMMAVIAVMVLQVKDQLGVVGRLRQEEVADRWTREKYDNLFNEYSQLAGKQTEWQSLLVNDEQGVAAFAKTVEGLASTANLTLEIGFDDLATKVELAGKQGIGVKMELKLNGDYQGMFTFVRSLETSDYLVKQDKLQLSKQDDGSYNMILVGALIMKQK